ncbi:hypothetical protein predicted by Glimmer/Critica [Sorangium cellulosum So ce56]|uniref:Uncharacterized protein n=1 Tax=Sorangium cellulosum (strain So ce56) TaxID=448385 RepID=A9FWH0_SORC5|nr:hypothetical protein predicted by Glimmer/Critica [Sorangium cellulosum So ce56]
MNDHMPPSGPRLDPSGHEPDGLLPLTRICDTIERDVRGSSPLHPEMGDAAAWEAADQQLRCSRRRTTTVLAKARGGE